MKNYLVILILINSQLLASSENWVPAFIKNLLIKTNEPGYEFYIDLDDKQKLASVSGRWKDIPVNVPPKEIVGLSEIFLQHAGVKVKSPVTDGEQEKVMLVLM